MLATVVALLLTPAVVGAQAPASSGLVPVQQRAELKAAWTMVPPKPLVERVDLRAPATANIQVTYTGFSPAAKAAFRAAVNIWQTKIVSTVPIKVDAYWRNLGPGVLGSAGPTALAYVANNKVEAIALAEAKCRCNLNGSGSEIEANFNSQFSAWYFGASGNVPQNKYDLQSTVLHEIGHGLGFFSTMTVSGNRGRWGSYTSPPRKNVFDTKQWSAAAGGLKLAQPSNFPNDSVALKNQLTDGTVYFKGQNVGAVLGGQRARLYAPSSWEPGSSNSHFDEATYNNTQNALMTPFLTNGEGARRPGPLMLALFRDIGWRTS